MKTMILFCLLVPVMAIGQVKEDFSDGNFNENPEWTGDTNQFEVNQAGQLHLASQGSDTSYLVTACSVGKEMEWCFWLKLSFNTSANNFARIFLASETPDLKSPGLACYLQAGGGDDSLFLIRREGINTEKIYRFRSYKTFHSTNTLRFKITKDHLGLWTVMIDTTGGTNYAIDGTFTDSRALPSGHFGLLIRYTSSNATKGYFDDVYAGEIVRDTIPPGIRFADMQSATRILLGFSEPMNREILEDPMNYHLGNSQATPDSAVPREGNTGVSLVFNIPIPERSCDSLRVNKLTDFAGNRMQDTLLNVCYYRPRAYDVLITEIMADPEPQEHLPEGEFVELHNRTVYPINMEGWSFCYGSTIKLFPEKILGPREYLIIAKNTSYQQYGECIFLFTAASSLPNEGETLVLKDRDGHVIHSVTYSSSWYGDSYKGEGGWSLEMIDPANPCGCKDNWGPSGSLAGGTPGIVNSVAKPNPDVEPPRLLRAAITDSVSLEAVFSEQMDSLSLTNPEQWSVTDSGEEVHPTVIELVPPDFARAKITFEKAFNREKGYCLHVAKGPTDCTGNPCDSSCVRFAYPEPVASGDVIINEILPDPFSGGARFIEIYNRSEKVIDLNEMVLAAGDTTGGSLPDAFPLSREGLLIFPGEYFALTPDPDDVYSRYPRTIAGRVIKMEEFPSFDEDTGIVMLARKGDNMVIDRVNYSREMHYPLLISSEGVSLERSSPDLPSSARDNWHSAAESAGFATPGSMNSHAVFPDDADSPVIVEPVLFSPDNDGHDDLLSVTIKEENADCAVRIDIYDSRGRRIRRLVNNMLSGSNTMFIWDGMTEEGGKVPIGFYILMVEITHTGGTVRHYKKAVVVAGKL